MKPVIAIVSTSGEDRSQPYVDAVVAHGGVARLVYPGDNVKKLIPRGLLLTGGGDLSEKCYDHGLSAAERKTLGKIEPEREQYERKLLSWASINDIPTLGICRGCQVMNVFAHGNLIPDIPAWYQQTHVSPVLSHRQEGDPALPSHKIRLDPSGQLYALLGLQIVEVNSSHHQGLSRCGSALTITARATDGIIEAIEDLNRKFWMGVQFHPERMWERFPIFSSLFRQFIEVAR